MNAMGSRNLYDSLHCVDNEYSTRVQSSDFWTMPAHTTTANTKTKKHVPPVFLCSVLSCMNIACHLCQTFFALPSLPLSSSWFHNHFHGETKQHLDRWSNETYERLGNASIAQTKPIARFFSLLLNNLCFCSLGICIDFHTQIIRKYSTAMCYVLKVLLHWLFLILLHLLSKIFFYVFKCCRSSAVIIVLLVLCLKSAKSALFSPSPYRGINCRDHQGWQCSSLSRPPPSSPSPPPSSPPITTTNHHHHQHHHDGGRAQVKPFLPRLVSCQLSFTLPPPTMPTSPSPRETRFCLIMLNLFPDTRRGRSTRTSGMSASVSTRTQSSPSTTRPRSTSIKVNWTPSN